jgi:AbrB family looped-hinge helix DNA binding protein
LLFLKIFVIIIIEKRKGLIQMANVIKKIDDLGRIAIPKEFRRALRLMGGDEIELIQKDNEIILRKYQPNISGQLQDSKEAFQEWLATNYQTNNDLMEQFQKLIEEVQKQEKKIGG